MAELSSINTSKISGINFIFYSVIESISRSNLSASTLSQSLSSYLRISFDSTRLNSSWNLLRIASHTIEELLCESFCSILSNTCIRASGTNVVRRWKYYRVCPIAKLPERWIPKTFDQYVIEQSFSESFSVYAKKLEQHFLAWSDYVDLSMRPWNFG